MREFITETKKTIVVMLWIMLALIIGSAVCQRFDDVRGYGIEIEYIK